MAFAAGRFSYVMSVCTLSRYHVGFSTDHDSKGPSSITGWTLMMPAITVRSRTDAGAFHAAAHIVLIFVALKLQHALPNKLTPSGTPFSAVPNTRMHQM